jgi:resuscitation-promoting factor RpfA
LSAVPRTGLGRYAYQGRHRTPDASGTAVRSAALSAGVAVAVLAGTATPATAAPTDDPWHRLRVCESGDNYRINTGNGYYGAYQFDAGTWRAYGGRGLPHQAAPAEQDRRAKMLYNARGWSPWPACSRKLGLRESPAYGAAAPVARRPAHPVTLTGPAAVTLQKVYRITGTSRPSSRITLKIRTPGGAWQAFPKRTDAKGRFSVAWRGRTDYQYMVVGESRSAVRTTRVAPTATAAPAAVQRLAAGGGPAVTVGGSSRPGATVVLYVRSSTGKWHTWTRLTAGSTGRWTLRLEAPSRAFQYYAKSANGLRSPIRSLTVPAT